MAAAITNPFTLTWGSFVIGGTTERLITGLHRLNQSHDAFEITVEVLIRGTSDSDFADNCAEMEDEFSKRRQRILWQVGASTVRDFNPAAGTQTALNSYATCQKVGTPGADTDRSCLYTVTLGCGLPADDTDGRRDVSITVDYDEARLRTITFDGVWTALSSNTATEQYAAQITAYTTSILDALTPSLASTARELVRERTTRDDQDQTIQFQRVFEEINVAQPGGSLDNANIVRPRLEWTEVRDQPGDSGSGITRLRTFVGTFTCHLDHTSSTDVQALYDDTIRAYMISEFEALRSPSQFAITNESIGIVPFANVVNITVTFVAAVDATDVVESVVTSKIVERSGTVLTGEWNKSLFAYHVDQGLGTRLRLGIRAVRVLGIIDPKERVGKGGGSVFGVRFDDGAELSALSDAAEDRAAGGASNWVLLDNESAATVKWMGQAGEDQFAVTDLVEMTVEQYVEDPGGTSLAPGQVGFNGPGGVTIPVGRVG